MFKIEPTAEIGTQGNDKRVIDRGRDVWLERVGKLGPVSVRGMKLIWGDRVIPFDMDRKAVKDPEFEGGYHYVIQISNFGNGPIARAVGELDGYTFNDEGERDAALMLATEAMLIFGGSYDGDRRPDGYNRVELGGRIYTKKDFVIV